jgi:hypothetical protein
MEVRRNPDLQAEFTSLATQQGRDSESLVAGLRLSARQSCALKVNIK